MRDGFAPKVKPFDSFSRARKWLTATGYCQLFEPKNRWSERSHKLYRKLSMFYLYIYVLRHIIFLVQARENPLVVMEGVYKTVPHILLTIKVTTMYFKTKRIGDLVKLIEDPVFAANSEQDEKYLKQNEKTMHRISNIVSITIIFLALIWGMDNIFQRMNDPNTIFYLYVPFETDTWPKFLIANFFDTYAMIFWVALGHMNIDCFIATCYAQVCVQLQIINYNLEHMFDDANKLWTLGGFIYHIEGRKKKSCFKYLDHFDDSLQKRFVFYIKRYERVYRYNNEITSIFNFTLTFQFIISSLASCLSIYQMSSADSMVSTNFIVAFGSYFVFNTQIYMYCSYGGLIRHESTLMADSLYLGDWLSLSPKFRKQFLIAMARWNRPITPILGGMIPLSPSTFLSVTKSAYTLFTVLKTRNSKDNENTTTDTTLAF